MVEVVRPVRRSKNSVSLNCMHDYIRKAQIRGEERSKDSVCVCLCWHSTEGSDTWIFQCSACFKFIPSTEAHPQVGVGHLPSSAASHANHHKLSLETEYDT